MKVFVIVVLVNIFLFINGYKSEDYLVFRHNWHDILNDSPHSGGSLWSEPLNWVADLNGEEYDNIKVNEFPGSNKENMIPNITIIHQTNFTKGIPEAHVVLSYFLEYEENGEQEKYPIPVELKSLYVDDFPIKIHSPLSISEYSEVENSTLDFIYEPGYSHFYDYIFKGFNITFSNTKVNAKNFDRPFSISSSKLNTCEFNIEITYSEYLLLNGFNSIGYSIFSSENTYFNTSNLKITDSTAFSSSDIFKDSELTLDNTTYIILNSTSFSSTKISLEKRSLLFIYNSDIDLFGNSSLKMRGNTYINSKGGKTFNFHDHSILIFEDFLPMSNSPIPVNLYNSSEIKSDCVVQDFQWIDLLTVHPGTKIHSNLCRLLLGNGLGDGPLTLPNEVQVDSSTIKSMNPSSLLVFSGSVHGYHGFIDSPANLTGVMGKNNETFTIKFASTLATSLESEMNFYIKSDLDYSLLTIESYALLQGKINVKFNPSYKFLPKTFTLIKFMHLNSSSLTFNIENKIPAFNYEFKTLNSEINLILTLKDGYEIIDSSGDIIYDTEKLGKDIMSGASLPNKSISLIVLLISSLLLMML